MKKFPSFLLVREKMREKAKIGASKMLKTPAFLGRFEKTIDKISILTLNHKRREFESLHSILLRRIAGSCDFRRYEKGWRLMSPAFFFALCTNCVC